MLSMSVRLVRRGLHRGAHAELSLRMHPEHPCCEEEVWLTPSGPTTFDLAGRRASVGLAARLGHGAKMPRLRFYNQRSRHEHSTSTPPSETARRADRASGEVRCCHLAVLGATPDHLAVIRPPTAACLTARAPASVRSTAASALARAAVGLRRFFGSPECPVDRDPPRPLCGRLVMVPASGSTSSHLIAARRGHVNAGGVPAIEGPFHRTRPLWALLREPAAARWAG